MSQMLKPNIQLFAEPGEGAAAEPNAQAKGAAGNSSAEPTGTKAFSEDYVSALRGESATYRTRAKTAEKALRQVLGLGESEDLGDLNARITGYQEAQVKAQDAALQKVNERLIQAELRALEGYDAKLLEKLVDRSKITVGEDGTVQGIEEAAKAVAEEFPAVLKTQETPAGGTGGHGNFGRKRDGGGLPTRDDILKMPYAARQALYAENPQKFKEIMKS